MIAILGLLMAMGAIFYSYKIGEMRCFREGMNYSDKKWETELKKRWDELNEQKK